MELESWLDGYDQRKNDLIAWIGEGGGAVDGARDLVSGLEDTLKKLRQKVQADAAAADLARLDDLLGGADATFGQAAPEKSITTSAPGFRPDPAPAPAPAPVPAAAPTPAPVSEPQPALASTAPANRPEPVPERAAPRAGGGAAEGILKSLAWTDSREPAPKSRAKTTSRPAALDMFSSAAPPAPAAPTPTAAAPAPAAPAPAPAPAAREPEPSPSSAPDTGWLRSFEPEPEGPAVAPAFEPPPAPATTISEPPRAAPEPAPAPVATDDDPRAALAAPRPAPHRNRKPAVLHCPDGEERRAALAEVGAGPDVPYLLHAVVEIPRGGGTGYVYHDTKDVFVVVDHPTADTSPALGHVAFGFVPGTVSDDGAHLDTFILSSGAAGPGELLRVRPLGYLRRADGDHKLLAVPEKHPAQSMADIPEPTLRACETWRNPTGVAGGTWCDGEKARELVRRCAG